jgi:hypothetical protein
VRSLHSLHIKQKKLERYSSRIEQQSTESTARLLSTGKRTEKNLQRYLLWSNKEKSTGKIPLLTLKKVQVS